MARMLWQAVTPEPHMWITAGRRAALEQRLVVLAQGLGRQVGAVDIEVFVERIQLMAPGTWPATGSSGSYSPLKRRSGRASMMSCSPAARRLEDFIRSHDTGWVPADRHTQRGAATGLFRALTGRFSRTHFG